jgi:hypothetical protein
MRSQFGPEQFLLASKKPHIIELVKNCVNMTETEIDALPEKPDVRRGLKNIKKNKDTHDATIRAEKIADAMMEYNKI